MSRSAIEASLRANSGDLTQWAVYADVLESEGDPRGALMSMMVSQERAPRVASADLASERQRLMAALTPAPLVTMAAREKVMSPVFRRGVIWSAGALDTDDFTALLDHPSCTFLQRVMLRPTVETFAHWATLLSSRGPAWRTLELDLSFVADQQLELGPWLGALPSLERLVLISPRVVNAVRLDTAVGLRSARLVNVAPEFLQHLARHAPNLARLELSAGPPWLANLADPGAAMLEPFVNELEVLVGRLTSLHVEGEVGERLHELLRRERKVVARAFSPPALPNAVSRRQCFEQAFLLVRGELPAEATSLVTQLARETGVSDLQLRRARFQRDLLDLELLRLHGVGEPLLPHQVARVLSQRHPALDVASIALSSTNGAVQSWSFGPHVQATKGAQARGRRDESFSFHDRVVREVVEGLIGFDAGPGLFDALALELELAPPLTVLGDGEGLDIFTELTRQASQLDPDDDEDDGEQPDELDHEPDFDDELAEEEAEVFGAPPAPPSPYLSDRPTWLAEDDGVRVLPGGFADDPARDDEPSFDATDVDLAELLHEGPVETPERHEDPAAEPFEPAPSDEERLVASSCTRCGAPRETHACASCGDEVCRDCVGSSAMAAWEDDKAFACLECSAPRALFVRRRPKA